MDDVLAVLDAAGCERPTVLAETEGTALACLFAATHPERVRSLALFAPIPRIVAAPDYPWAHDPVRRETFIERSVARLGGGRDARRHRARRTRATPQLREWFGRMERLAVGPAAVEPAMRVIGEHRRARHPAADPRPDARHPPRGRRARSTAATPSSSATTCPAPASSSCRGPRASSSSTTPSRSSTSSRSSSRAPAPPARPSACSRPSCSPTSSARPSARPRSATARGASCSTPITRSSAPSSRPTAATRSRRWATASSPPSTGRRARSAARCGWPSARAPPASRSAPASTPASASASAATSPGSPSTSPRA